MAANAIGLDLDERNAPMAPGAFGQFDIMVDRDRNVTQCVLRPVPRNRDLVRTSSAFHERP
jgi:hypothetical protein